MRAFICDMCERAMRRAVIRNGVVLCRECMAQRVRGAEVS